MSADDTVDETDAGAGGGFLGMIERVGNKVPNPTIMFLYLIAGLMVLSAILAAFDISVTDEVAVPTPIAVLEDIRESLGGSVVPYDVATNQIVEIPDYRIVETTFEVRSLLSVDGLRFVFSTFVANFAAFGVVAVTLVAMAGVGVAEQAGMMGALIRKIVKVAPPSRAGVHPHPRRRDLQRRLRRRVPHPHPARRRGVLQRRAATRSPAWPPPSPASARSSASTS